MTTQHARSVVTRTEIATRPRGHLFVRKALFAGALALVPAAIGTAVGMLARSRRAGSLAGGLAAGGLAVARWQLQRWFNDEPAYATIRRIGDLELRRYEAHVIARTSLEETAWDVAQEQGFHRLASYLFGANSTQEELAMTGPVEMLEEGTGHAMSFVMPPCRTLASLPRPTSAAVRLLEVPERTVAVLAYRGRYDAEAFAQRSTELVRQVAAAGLSAKGRPMFAGFDPPSTLPILRRNEIWIEVV